MVKNVGEAIQKEMFKCVEQRRLCIASISSPIKWSQDCPHTIVKEFICKLLKLVLKIE